MNFLLHIWRQRNYRVAIAVALLSALWLLSGELFSGAEPPVQAERVSAQSDGNGELMRVQAKRIQAQPHMTRVLVNGRTEPNRSLRLRAELDGVVAALPVAEGEQVDKGDVICALEAEDRPERLARARAALKKAELDYAGAQRLKNKGLQSDTGLAQQEVALANARAELKRAQLDLDNLRIRAPFAGVVNRHAVELGDFIRRGEECATLLDLDPILVVGEVAESRVGELIPGGDASAQLQQGQRVAGRLRYVSQQADPVTRAYRVEVAVDNAAGALRSGLSGQLALPTGEIFAHRVSSSLLTLDDRGELGLRIVGADQRVQFVNVRLVGDADSGVWVSGLPAQTTLITVGQEYVSAGDLVSVELERGAADLPAPSSVFTEASTGEPQGAALDQGEAQ